MNSIIEKITTNPKAITEDDVSWILPELLVHFDQKILKLSLYAYDLYGATSGLDVAKRAFKEHATETLDKGFRSYMFKSQHWRSGHNLTSYLITCLNRLASSIKKNSDAQVLINVPVCPACKTLNQKEPLHFENKVLRCYSCLNMQDVLKDRIKNCTDDAERMRYEYEINLRKIFATHSRKGFGCPSCNRFIPQSYIRGQRVSCPYDSDCEWFGHIDELQTMNHPLGLSSRHLLSLNNKVDSSSGVGSLEHQDNVKSADVNADIKIQVEQQCREEIITLRSVIDLQSKRLEKEFAPKTIKKKLMYQAFKNMLDEFPDDMVSYLVHQNHTELPIQSRIFQEFIKLVENALPLDIYHEGKVVEVYSLQDPRLDLFLGMSEFWSYIKPDGSIPNNTSDVYVGGRQMKDHGPCFIGQLLDVRSENDESLLEFVDYYTFSQIRMTDDLPPGLRVKVSHFRIPSHYEMHGLVHLQRIRRRIVDSVYQKLNGKKRVVGK